MKLTTFRVTKKDISKHWNGGALSCPIHASIQKELPKSHVSVSPMTVWIDKIRFSLPRSARRFSTIQGSMFMGEDKTMKSKALRVLKPFSFKLRVR